MTPQELITAYRAELSRLYGVEIAEATYLIYRRGWFYLSLAHWRPDLGNALIRGSAGATHTYRRQQFERMLNELQLRTPHGPHHGSHHA